MRNPGRIQGSLYIRPTSLPLHYVTVTEVTVRNGRHRVPVPVTKGSGRDRWAARLSLGSYLTSFQPLRSPYNHFQAFQSSTVVTGWEASERSGPDQTTGDDDRRRKARRWRDEGCTRSRSSRLLTTSTTLPFPSPTILSQPSSHGRDRSWRFQSIMVLGSGGGGWWLKPSERPFPYAHHSLTSGLRPPARWWWPTGRMRVPEG